MLTTVKAPINSVIATAMGWLRYHNEVRKENAQFFLPDTALELQALWAIGEVHDVSPTIKDAYIRENLRPGTTILFRFAPCATLDGAKLGNPGIYVVRYFAIDGYFEPGEFNPTVSHIYQKITHPQSLQSSNPSYADAPSVHPTESSPLAQSPILIARTTVNGVF